MRCGPYWCSRGATVGANALVYLNHAPRAALLSIGWTWYFANVTGFLCSKDAGYVNGQVVAVDGGFEAAGVGLPTVRKMAAE